VITSAKPALARISVSVDSLGSVVPASIRSTVDRGTRASADSSRWLSP